MGIYCLHAWYPTSGKDSIIYNARMIDKLRVCHLNVTKKGTTSNRLCNCRLFPMPYIYIILYTVRNYYAIIYHACIIYNTQRQIYMYTVLLMTDGVGLVTLLLHVISMHAIKTYSFPCLEYFTDLRLVLSGLHPSHLIFNL